jgi:hypothetical protein
MIKGLILAILIALFGGCAGPEPYRPIDRYRALYFYSQ